MALGRIPRQPPGHGAVRRPARLRAAPGLEVQFLPALRNGVRVLDLRPHLGCAVFAAWLRLRQQHAQHREPAAGRRGRADLHASAERGHVPAHATRRNSRCPAPAHGHQQRKPVREPGADAGTQRAPPAERARGHRPARRGTRRQFEPLLPGAAEAAAHGRLVAVIRPAGADVRLFTGGGADRGHCLWIALRRNGCHELRTPGSHQPGDRAVRGDHLAAHRWLVAVARIGQGAGLPRLPGADAIARIGDHGVVAVVHTATAQRSCRRLLSACLSTLPGRAAGHRVVRPVAGAHHVHRVQGRHGVPRRNDRRGSAAQ